MQDRVGLIWIGTLSGLNRYDGYTMATYRPVPGDITSLSHAIVYTLYEDRSGVLWVGTEEGLNRFDRATDRFTRFQHDDQNPESLSHNSVRAIYEDSSGTLWVGTAGGLNRFDRERGTFTVYQHDPANPQSLSSNVVSEIYEDSGGTLWVGTAGGLNRFDRQSGRFTAYGHDPADPRSLSNDYVQEVLQDRSGVLWVGTWGGGLNRFDPASGQFVPFRNEPGNPASLSDDRVQSIIEDDAGALWVATFGNGLSVLDPQRAGFTTITVDRSNPEGLRNTRALDVYEDRSGLIWVATEGGGVYVYNPSQSIFATYRHDPDDDTALASDHILGVAEAHDGQLWVGTQNRGLDLLDPTSGAAAHFPPDPADPGALGFPTIFGLYLDPAGALWVATYGGGLYRRDPATGRFTAYRHNPNDPSSISNDRVTAVTGDRAGFIWASTEGGGVNRLDPKTGKFTAYRHNPADPTSIGEGPLNTILVDRQGMVWAGGFGSLSRLNPATGAAMRFPTDPNDPGGLGNDTVAKIYEDRRGDVWVTTWDGVLHRFNPSDNTFAHFKPPEGETREPIFHVLEAPGASEESLGPLWLVRNRSLAHFDRESETMHVFDRANGVPQVEFTRGAQVSAGGTLLLGSTGGLIVVDPEQLRTDPTPPPIVFGDFLLANQPAPIGGESPLGQTLDTTSAIVLPYDERIVSFAFAALDYRAPGQNRYRYRLEGFDKGWNEVDATRRLVTYTNLEPGRYVFQVTAANADGVWNEQGRALTLVVTPPWWGTWWFRILVAGLVVGAGAGAYALRVGRLQAQQRRLEQLVAVRTSELAEKTAALEMSNAQLETARDEAEAANRAKSTFLATMSHELRTPLNVILGFAQVMDRSPTLPPEHHQGIRAIQRNGDHLLSMINNVLDLGRIEASQVVVEEAVVDLGLLLDDLQLTFERLAASKGLCLRVERNGDLPRLIRTDGVKLRQVLINLLVNAVKFTMQGEVVLTASQRRPAPGSAVGELLFEVADTGPGLTLEEQEHIFQPFAQVQRGAAPTEGTGLGLAISRSYARLMGGSLTVSSQPGSGARFGFTLPLVLAAPLQDVAEAVRRMIAGEVPDPAPSEQLDRPPALDPDALAALPAAQLADLERAAIETDPVALETVVIGISAVDPALAQALGAHVKAFEYRQILRGIRAARGLHG
ncbi:MAG: hypothetical protein HGA45_01980 [Chloroflexales bacterium]|nr:hypothetical protein [Chloroflexales bacterium]